MSTLDQASGDIYYYHAGRQISQWDRPTDEDNAPLKKSTGNLDEWGFGDGDSAALGSLGLDDDNDASKPGSGTVRQLRHHVVDTSYRFLGPVSFHARRVRYLASWPMRMGR